MTSTDYAQHIVYIAIIGYHRTYLFCRLHRGYISLPELNIAYLMLLGWPWSKGSDQSNRFTKRFGAPNLLARKNLGDSVHWIFSQIDSMCRILYLYWSIRAQSTGYVLLSVAWAYSFVLKLVRWLRAKRLYTSNPFRRSHPNSIKYWMVVVPTLYKVNGINKLDDIL